MESIQYNAALTITGAIRGTSTEKTLSRTRLRPFLLLREVF